LLAQQVQLSVQRAAAIRHSGQTSAKRDVVGKSNSIVGNLDRHGFVAHRGDNVQRGRLRVPYDIRHRFLHHAVDCLRQQPVERIQPGIDPGSCCNGWQRGLSILKQRLDAFLESKFFEMERT
jgi:hypothetical protein